MGAEASGDVHLRSVGAVAGYRISAENEEFGEVADFIADDQSWAIRWRAARHSDRSTI